MSFFLKSNSSKKQKKKPIKNGKVNFKKKSRKRNEEELDSDEEILSDDLDDSGDEEQYRSNKKVKLNKEDENDSESDYETAQEKKIRLAKKYLSELSNREQRDVDEEEETDQVHRSNLISTQLKESVLEKSGQLHRKVADSYSLPSLDQVVILKNGHRKSITCCAVSFDGKYVFTASKDCNIIKWETASGKRIKSIFGNPRHKSPDQFKGHAGTINALAVSSDFKFLASGCVNRLIHIWSPTELAHVHTFRGHRDSITGLAFRRSFHQLFSCSADRMVKVWNLDEMAYIESLFGHHDTITGIDSFVRERAITCGGRDGSIRLWKIPEESHLIFLSGGEATIDAVRFIDESHFLSAADNGSIQLWAIFKKKPLVTKTAIHGQDCWITSIASLRNSDLFATGSFNGKICFWKISSEFRSVEKLFEYNVVGFVNWMEFSSDGRFLVAAISQEHRLGRWWRIKEARNVVHVIPLTCTSL